MTATQTTQTKPTFKAVVEQPDLLESLTRVAYGPSTRPVLPAVALVATEAGLRCAASHHRGRLGFVRCEQVVPTGTVVRSGRVHVDAWQLAQVLAHLDPKPVVEIEATEYGIIIYNGNACVQLRQLDTAEPELTTKMRKLGRVDSCEFRGLIDKTLYAASTDEARVNLNGAQLVVDCGVGTMAATDGHRLAWSTAALGLVSKVEIVVPRRALVMLQHLLAASPHCDVLHEQLDDGGQMLVVRIGGVALTVRARPVAFPSWQDAVPKKHPVHQVTVDRRELEQAVRLLTRLAPGNGAIRVELTSGALEFTTARDDFHPRSLESRDHVVESRDHIVVALIEDDVGVAPGEQAPAEVEATTKVGVLDHARNEPLASATMTLGFNACYMLEALSVLDGELVTLEIHGKKAPCLMRDSDQVCLLMPMRL